MTSAMWGFGGACPPPGDKPHHYHFTVWALNTPTLPIDAIASGALVGFYAAQPCYRQRPADGHVRTLNDRQRAQMQNIHFQHNALSAAEITSRRLYKLHRVRLFACAVSGQSWK